MKALVFTLLVASAYALPQKHQNQQHHHHQQHQQARYEEDHLETSTWVPILKYNKEQGNDGSYKAEYETGNKIFAQETGYLKDFSNDKPQGSLVQQGSYTYEAPDGQIINVQYTADENGFQAHGDHLPTPPPIPPEIQKGLDEIYASIKIIQERRAQEAKTNPKFAEEEARRRELDYYGQYYQQ